MSDTILLILAFACIGILTWWFGFPASVYRLVFGAARRLMGFREKVVNAGGVDVPYLDNGGGGETLLLVHGYMADRFNFLFLSRFLHRKYRIIMPDLPGFGDSGKPLDNTYSLGFFAETMQAVLAHAGVEKAHLAGNSLGGAVIIVLAARRPEIPLSLFLLDPAGLVKPGKGDLFDDLASGVNPFLNGDIAAFRKFMYKYVLFKRVFIPGPMMRAMFRRTRNDRAVLTLIMADLTTVREGTLEEELRSIRAPVLVGWGSEDRMLSPSLAPEFQKMLPGSKLVWFRGSGHCPHIESPRETYRAYSAFLDDLEQR